MKETDKIELRSEKVRNVIGTMPPALTRYGITIMAIIFIGLILATCYIPYPKNVLTSVIVTDCSGGEIKAFANIPYRYVTDIKKEMSVQIEWEGFPAQRFGYTQARIINLDDSIIVRNNQNYLRARLLVIPTQQFEIKDKMRGNAMVLITNQSIIEYLWSRN